MVKNNKNIIKGAQKKFGDLFSEKLFLSQLVYFGDLQDFTIDFIAKEHSKEEIKSFLEKEVREYKKEIM